ncbi:MAG: histidine phosphatase family protein, partial [Actinomycetota bacterium]|nr:histidine phosphatase family protein [Actinomycetota bacterium]
MLILVRHGRTAANAEGLLQGRLDQHLDDVGRAQALAVAAMIGEVDELISSPLLRATETAEAFGRDVTIDERWIELSYGCYEGRPYTGVASDVWARWYEDPNFAPEGGESLVALDERVRAALADVIERAGERNIVVVTHVSPIKAAVARVIGGSYDFAFRSHLSHAAVCRIQMRAFGPVLFSFNETAPT